MAFEVGEEIIGGEVRTIALSLDQVNGAKYRLELTNGKLEKCFMTNQQHSFDQSGYKHQVVVSTSGGTLQFEDLPYQPSPYLPESESMEVELYMHPTGKAWAIGSNNNRMHVFFANADTEHRYVHQIVKTLPVGERQVEKTQKGYVYQGNKFFCGKTRSII